MIPRHNISHSETENGSDVVAYLIRIWPCILPSNPPSTWKTGHMTISECTALLDHVRGSFSDSYAKNGSKLSIIYGFFEGFPFFLRFSILFWKKNSNVKNLESVWIVGSGQHTWVVFFKIRDENLLKKSEKLGKIHK